MRRKLYITLTLGILAIIAYYAAVPIYGILYIGGAFRPKYSLSYMERYFTQNNESHATIVDYLSRTNCNSVDIYPNVEKAKIRSKQGLISIDDDIFIDAINKLTKKHYDSIHKVGSTVYFQRSKNRNFGQGIAFSIDGSELIIQFCTKLASLDEVNWYYYESDYSKWRKQNQN